MYEDIQPGQHGRWRLLRRPVVVVSAAVAVLLVAGLSAVAAVTGEQEAAAPLWRAAPIASPTVRAQPSATEPPRPKAISLSATGDIIMGNAPSRLPANGGKGFFDGVRRSLAADLVMGNLEEPLTDDTGYAKCVRRPAGAGPSAGPSATPTKPTGCHQFRAPPEYARHLREAGFEVLNQANNHGNDYGPAGYRNTRKALTTYGLRHTGAPDEITVVDVDDLRVAVVGFSAYSWSNSLTDISSAKRVVQKAARQADLVVVQVHMGAEGADKTRVRPGTELFLGENRGDPVKFSHAVIDAGADLVVGHGPHVLRALEFYQGRLIAYSLGNFAGGAGTLNNSGRLGLGAVLKVSLERDGGFAGGEFISTYMNGAGKPTLDGRKRGLALVTQLCRKDFPTTGARLDGAGNITPPAG